MAKKAWTSLEEAIETVKRAVDDAAERLAGCDMEEFYEALAAEAEGWAMTLDDLRRDRIDDGRRDKCEPEEDHDPTGDDE